MAGRSFFRRRGGKNRRGHRQAVSRFIGGAIAFSLLFGFAYYLLSPKVTISVYPATNHVRRTFLLEASTLLKEVDIPNARLPARVIRSAFTLEHSVPTTGRRVEGLIRARGTIVFSNKGARSLFLPKGTVVAAHGGSRFRTKQALRVPPASPRVFSGQIIGMNSGVASVEVEALERGTIGNVDSGSVAFLLGGVLPDLEVTNPEPITGGEDRVIRMVSRGDAARALQGLEEKASEAFERLTSGLFAGEKLLLETASWDMGEPGFDKGIGEEGETLNVSAPVIATGLAIRESDLVNIVNKAFAMSLLEDQVLDRHEVGICEIRCIKLDENTAGLEVIAERDISQHVEPSAIVRAIAGLKMEEARDVLGSLPSIQRFNIETGGRKPERLPWFGHWVRVQVR